MRKIKSAMPAKMANSATVSRNPKVNQSKLNHSASIVGARSGRRFSIRKRG